MLDQASNLRQLARNALSKGNGAMRVLPMVIVSGGKGGVGTSTVALQLAMALTRCGQRGLLVEADIDRGGPLKQQIDGGSIRDCMAGRSEIESTLERYADGTWVLPSAWAPREIVECTAMAQDRFIHELRALSSKADILIVDVGSSRNHFVRRFWQAASMVLMVTTPDPESVMDTYAAIKVMSGGETSVPVYTLVNHCADAGVAENVHERVRVTCKRFLGLRTSTLGAVPSLAEETAQREPCFDMLAESLSIELALATQPRRSFAVA